MNRQEFKELELLLQQRGLLFNSYLPQIGIGFNLSSRGWIVILLISMLSLFLFNLCYIDITLCFA